MHSWITCCGVSTLPENYSRSVFTVPVVAGRMSCSLSLFLRLLLLLKQWCNASCDRILQRDWAALCSAPGQSLYMLFFLCFFPHGLELLLCAVVLFLGLSHDYRVSPCYFSPKGLELSSKRKKMEWQLDSEDECEDDLEKTLELRQVDTCLSVCVCVCISDSLGVCTCVRFSFCSFTCVRM